MAVLPPVYDDEEEGEQASSHDHAALLEQCRRFIKPAAAAILQPANLSQVGGKHSDMRGNCLAELTHTRTATVGLCVMPVAALAM